MSSAHSASDETAGSGFDLLDRGVQRWVWQRGWKDLHDVQNRAIPPILAGERDVLIGAATAAGKTEAAFLPICSRLVSDPTPGPGVKVLYLSPLKALINDQFRRVDQLCDGLGIPTHRWHGDVASSKKTAMLRNPDGILLTTPESLEAMFARRGTRIPLLFRGLRYVVVDELHSFLGIERGTQLVSLLHRLETVLRTQVPRIGLSATLGDMSIAAEQLRPGSGQDVIVVNSSSGGQEVRLQVRGCLNATSSASDDKGQPTGSAAQQIADHLFRVMRGSTNLVFANSRNMVEELAARLADVAEREHSPNEFHPHHGNLAKELREDVEAILRDASRPATAVCTSTLEMGIDIGDVAQVGQIGPPPSVASLRQRLGRSGRRDQPSTLRAYVTAYQIDAHSAPLDRLQPGLVQTIAAIELLRESWCEPPDAERLDLSTLVQQLLSLIAQCGGARPEQAYRWLCGKGGPFTHVSADQFALLVRELASRDVLIQSADRTLLAGTRGDREVNHYTFYAAFRTEEEYRLVCGDTTLGTMPIGQPLRDGQLLLFAARRWRVVAVHDEDKVIELAPAAGGVPAILGALSNSVHSVVRAKMRAILYGEEQFAYLDQVAARMLRQARDAYAELRLDERAVLRDGEDVLVLSWTGDRELGTLAQLLVNEGLDATVDGMALRIADSTESLVLLSVQAIARHEPPTEIELARQVQNKIVAKYDSWLGDELLSAEYATTHLDCASAVAVARKITHD
jgi:ATP-dependent Lhr-like helicase